LRGDPRGAWLIRRPHDDSEHVYINGRSDIERDIWDVIGIFDVATGAFIRELDRKVDDGVVLRADRVTCRA
jgi:hypothetical protein